MVQTCWHMNVHVVKTDVENNMNVYEGKVISALWLKPKFNLDLISKEIHIFGFQCCSTHEDLSIDVIITTVGQILT